jgi:hypothetical protein
MSTPLNHPMVSVGFKSTPNFWLNQDINFEFKREQPCPATGVSDFRDGRLGETA